MNRTYDQRRSRGDRTSPAAVVTQQGAPRRPPLAGRYPRRRVALIGVSPAVDDGATRPRPQPRLAAAGLVGTVARPDVGRHPKYLVDALAHATLPVAGSLDVRPRSRQRPRVRLSLTKVRESIRGGPPPSHFSALPIQRWGPAAGSAIRQASWIALPTRANLLTVAALRGPAPASALPLYVTSPFTAANL
jgi:hypothetical protein